MNHKLNTKKLTISGLLIALGIVCSTFYIPIGASKCFPIQHTINVIAAVLLGPIYGVSMAFCTSFLRILFGTGSFLAFPGSMVGALLCSLLYLKTKSLVATFLGEAIGTGIFGALLAYPIATLIMGKEAALFTYVLPFLISSSIGAFFSVLFLSVLEKTKVLSTVKQTME